MQKKFIIYSLLFTSLQILGSEQKQELPKALSCEILHDQTRIEQIAQDTTLNKRGFDEKERLALKYNPKCKRGAIWAMFTGGSVLKRVIFTEEQYAELCTTEIGRFEYNDNCRLRNNLHIGVTNPDGSCEYYKIISFAKHQSTPLNEAIYPSDDENEFNAEEIEKAGQKVEDLGKTIIKAQKAFNDLRVSDKKWTNFNIFVVGIAGICIGGLCMFTFLSKILHYNK